MGYSDIFTDLDFKNKNGTLLVPDTDRIEGLSVYELAKLLTVSYNFQTDDTLVYTPVYNTGDLLEDADGIATITNLPNTLVQDEGEYAWRKFQVSSDNLSVGADISVNGTPLTLDTSSISGIKKMSGGQNSVFLLMNDGTVRAAGNNDNGRLGTGNNTRLQYFTKIDTLENIKDIVTFGDYATFALTNSGELYVTGRNPNGHLGLGHTNDVYTFTLSLTGVESIECSATVFGSALTAVKMKDGTMRIAGRNDYGQCGVNTTTDCTTWVNPGLTNIKQVVCTNTSVTILLNTGELYSMGYNYGLQLGIPSITATSATVKVPALVNFDYSGQTIKDIYSGYTGIFILMTNGNVYYTGANDYYQFGNNTTTNVLGFQQMSVSNIVDINATSTRGAFFLNSLGDVFFCGENISSFATSLSSPVKTPQQILSGVKSLDTRKYKNTTNLSSMFVMQDGTVKGCGYNGTGTLGDNTTTNRTSFVSAIGVTNVDFMARTENSCYALTTDGTLYVWGANVHGQLGIGNTTNKTLPVITTSHIITVNEYAPVEGNFNSLDISTNGTVDRLRVKLWV